MAMSGRIRATFCLMCFFCLISEEISFLNPLSPHHSTFPFHLFATTVFQGHIQTNDLCEKWIHQDWPWTQLLFAPGTEIERMKGFCAGAQSVRHMCSRKCIKFRTAGGEHLKERCRGIAWHVEDLAFILLITPYVFNAHL